MSLLRFVHAADLHLDSPFTGLTRVAPDIASYLRDATFRAYDGIIDLCLREKVDALLVAGDVYDSADRSLRAQLKFVDGLRRLDDAGIRSFVCHGNHDPLDGWQARLSFPPGCHRFGAKVEGVPFDLVASDRAIVYGVSYPRRDVRESLIPRFPIPKSGVFSIGLLHCNVDGNTEHDSYAPCTTDDLAATGIDYWALGHVHNRKVLRQEGPTVVYPGNPQGRHPKEVGARGVYVVDVSESGTVSLEFQAVDSVRWENVDLSINGLETEQDLLNLIRDRMERATQHADGRHLIYRVEIHGYGPLHHSLRRPGFVDDITEHINEWWVDQAPFVWCEHVHVTTTVPFDREERSQAADFMGDLLRLIDETRSDDDGLDRLSTELQALFTHARVKRYLRDFVPSREDIRALLIEAETRCVQELIEEAT